METIVGVNKYQSEDYEELDVHKVDNTEVRRKQIERLLDTRNKRNEERVRQCLGNLSKSAESGEGNLLELAIEAT
jgi:methylmalonyl-CoA mutase